MDFSSFNLKIKQEVVVKEEEPNCWTYQDLPPDVQKVIVGEESELHQDQDQDQDQEQPELPHIKEEPDQDQDQEEPEPPHIKEEQEELWSSQEGEQQLQGLEEADITKFTFTPVPVKSEDDGEKPQSSQLHQTHTEHMETEAAGEDCGGPGPHRDPGPGTGDSSGPETDDSWDWKDTRETQSGSNSVKNQKVSITHGLKPYDCSECGRKFTCNTHLKSHMRTHTGERPYSCSVCHKSFTQSGCLHSHMSIHTGEKPFECSVCGQRFRQKIQLTQHTAVHGGETPFSCTVCGKGFIHSSQMKIHMRSHTGEKPYSCSVCGKGFKIAGNVTQHMRVHSREKPLSCSVCDKSFHWPYNLKRHKCVGVQPSELHPEAPPARRPALHRGRGRPGPHRNSDPHELTHKFKSK